jgi:hypothetical protein
MLISARSPECGFYVCVPVCASPFCEAWLHECWYYSLGKTRAIGRMNSVSKLPEFPDVLCDEGKSSRGSSVLE